jgi:hypothetical protein
LKKLRHRKSEADVMSVVDDICNPENYYTYEFPPPEMKDGCHAFIADHEEILESLLMKRKNNEEVEEKLCYDISDACKNVNVKDAPKFDDQIFIDGQPHKVVSSPPSKFRTKTVQQDHPMKIFNDLTHHA